MPNSLFVSIFAGVFIFISSLIYLTSRFLYILLLFMSLYIPFLFIFPVSYSSDRPAKYERGDNNFGTGCIYFS